MIKILNLVFYAELNDFEIHLSFGICQYFCLFLLLNNNTLYEYVTFCFSTDGYLEVYHFLTIMNNADMNILI